MIDFSQIPIQRTGVGVYADHLISELPKLLRAEDHLYVLAQSNDVALASQLRSFGDSRISVLLIPALVFRNRITLLAFEQFILPFLLLRLGIDVLHSLHYTYPLWSPCARVVTIHDLTHTLFPELHTRSRRILCSFFCRKVLKYVECPVFVSQATQRDAERLFGHPRYPGLVTPLGVSTPTPMTESDVQGELAALDLNAPFFLFLGTLEPRKNVVRLIQAFEQVASSRPGLRLVIAGKWGWHTDAIAAALRDSPHRQALRHLGFVSERQKAALLAACTAVVYPSLYEGFGLPVLEAMASGAAVITSNLSSMPEVAGDAAILVNPESVPDIAAGMERLLVSQSLKIHLQKQGPVQAARFTWRTTAETTLAAYHQATQAWSNKHKL